MTIESIKREIVVLVTLIVFFIIAGFFPWNIKAADWPERDITIIVAYNPGGGFDVVTRLTAPFIAKHLPKRVNVVVKNVPGAGTRIGARELVKAKPDGNTIAIFEPVSLAIMQEGGKLEWLDIEKLSWLVRLNVSADMILVGPKTGFKQPADMKGKTVRFAALDDATTFRSALVAKKLGATPAYIRYSGTSEAVMTCLRGDLDAVSLSWSSAMRQVNATEGKMIPLMVSSKVSGLDVPSGKDLRIDVDEIIMDHSLFMVGPAGLPLNVRRIWEETFAKVVKDPEWADKMGKLGYTASPLLGRKNLDANVNAVMKRMDSYKDIFKDLALIK